MKYYALKVLVRWQHQQDYFKNQSHHLLRYFKIKISVIIDASSLCTKASFNYGTAAATRQYDIKVR